MLWYIVKLLVVLPLIGALIWGSLKLSRHMQQRLGAPQGGRSVRVVETMMLSPTIRLAVLEFHGREILVSASRHGLARLAEAPARSEGDGDVGGGSGRAPSAPLASPYRASPNGTGESFSHTLRRFQ